MEDSVRQNHERYMHRCFQLARLSGKAVAKNPNVGAVIVYKDQIIGEGYHKAYGGPHAEVYAVESVQSADKHLLTQATLYVSLEPCCITGKTPPCTDLILKTGIPRVIYAVQDPHGPVNGNSYKLLRAEGVEVVTGILEQEGRDLIRPFVANLDERPYIVLKWAQSADGYIGKRGQTIAISHQMTNVRSHTWRREMDGILVGHNTVLSDDPLLTARHVPGQNPQPIIMSDDVAGIKHSKLMSQDKPPHVYPREDIGGMLDDLYKKGIYRLLVEGGAKTHKRFIEKGYWDEARIIKSPTPLGGGIRAAGLRGKVARTEDIAGDQVEYVYRN